MKAEGEITPLKGGNPGWAGERGDFPHLSEADIRGSTYVGVRPRDGGVGGAVSSMPYMVPERNPEAPLFEGPYAERLQKILSRYPDKMGALHPVMNMAEEVRGYLTPETMERVAEILELSPTYVRGMATFYSMYNRAPVGKYFVQVCTNVSCNLCGGEDVARAFLDETGTEPGVTSEDGLFTVMEVECLGACGFPTVVQVNSRYFENVAVEDVPEIVRQLRAGQHSTDAGDGASGVAGDGRATSSPSAAGRSAGGAAGQASSDSDSDSDSGRKGH